MSTIDLSQYGITGSKVIHNPSWDQLFIDETNPELTGYEKGQETELGAVNVMTGIYTGRSPKDKFFVMDDTSKDTIWWTSDEYKNDNKPITTKTWDALKAIADKELCDKTLYVVDAFCGTNPDTRLAVRFIMEVAWQAHFVTNMFIRPTEEELKNFKPDFVVLNASKAKVENWKELGINSETCVAFNLTERMQLIINTWYGGEMKKGMFSIMNYYLPSRAWLQCTAQPTPTRKAPTPLSSSASQVQVRLPFQPTRSVCLSATTNMVGTTTACSTSKVAAMQRLSTSTRTANPTSTTLSHATLFLKTLLLTRTARSTSPTRA